MLFLGETGSAQCSIKWKENSLHVSGSKSGFYGYKLDSISGKNGIFAEWHIENDCLILTNDKFGLFPLFYTNNGSGFSFSSSIVDLLVTENDRQLDEAAIAIFLRTGSYIGDATPFANIKALPPGAQLRFNKEGLFLENSKIMFGERASVSLNEAQDIYGDVFHDSITKFSDVFSKKVGIPLSGGRDSRHILFELMASGMQPFSSITMKHQPPKSDEDAEIAKEVSSHLGIEHIILEQDLSFLGMEKEKNKITNFCSLQHSWILPLSRHLAAEGYSAIFDGIGGDVLSASSFLTETRLNLYRKEKFEDLANDVLGPEGYLPSILTKPAYKRFGRELAINLLIDELKTHANAPNPVGQFFFWNRTRRNTAVSSWRILSKNTHVFAPFLDHGVYTFLSSLPAEYFLDHTFHQRAMEKRYPEHAHIPYEKKISRPKKGSFVSRFFQVSELLLYFLRSCSRQSIFHPTFLYSRMLKGLLSAEYYYRTRSMYRLPIFLFELSKYTSELNNKENPADGEHPPKKSGTQK